MSVKQPVICLMGPTAAGKTDLACSLTKVLPIDLISVDSAMVYRHMNIGTAKPSTEFLEQYPHALVDIRDPSDSFSVGDFMDAVKPLINASHAKQRIPLLVGGTMMYFHVLHNGLSTLPKSDASIRKQLALKVSQLGIEQLHAELSQFDVASYQRIKPKDSQRILRAHEVYRLTKKPISHWQQATVIPEYALKFYAIFPQDRQQLHLHIAQRFQQMLLDGLVAEVDKLYQRQDLSINLPAIKSVGYRQVWQYLQGEVSYQDMQQQGIAATRQLAKRQITWLKRWQAVTMTSDVDYLASKIILDHQQWC